MTITVNLETVTPLFLSGGDPRGTPELRVPSIRGVLRYWLRAALGGVFGDHNVETLRMAESAVFGDTLRASGVVIKLSPVAFEPILFEKQSPVFDEGSRAKPKPTGRDYLFWSMAGFSNQPPKQAIPENTKFSITLTPRPGASNETDILFQSAAALWLLVHLGSLGSRSRRTAGSLRAIEPVSVGNVPVPNFIPPDIPQEFVKHLEQGLTAIRREIARIHNIQNMTIAPPTRFDVLHPSTCKIWVLTDSKPWTTSTQAVEEIGARLRDFRNRRLPDHDTVREWLEKGEKPQTVERAVFGLPLPFRYSGGGPVDVLQGRNHDRRASPLSLRVSQIASRNFVGIAILFESELLPYGEVLQFQRSKNETEFPTTYELIRHFVTEKFTCWEVNYA